MTSPRGRSALGLALAVAVVVPVATRAGFTPGSRALLLVLAGPVLALALLVADDVAVRAARAPAVLALWALAALAVISAAWTVGAPADAVRWGFVLAGYGALAVGGAVLARQPGGVIAIAAGLCVLAVVTGLIGLAAAGARAEPYALRIGGSWRPAAFFEYPPALAALEVAALAPLLAAMTRARQAVALAAAAGVAVSAAVIVLADSRFALAAGAVVAAVALLRPAAPPLLRLAAAGLMGAAGVGAGLLAGGAVAVGDTGGDAGRLAGLALVVAIAPAAWWLALRAPRGAIRFRTPRHARTGLALAGAAVAVVLGAAAAPSLDPAASGGERRAGFTHGRTGTWEAAIDVWADRSLLGHGADTFLLATREAQPGRPIRYAHDLPLEVAVELGLAGLLAALALYAGGALALARARATTALELLGPLVAVFLAANLVDWTWRLAGFGAAWAVGLGALVGAAGIRRVLPIPDRAA